MAPVSGRHGWTLALDGKAPGEGYSEAPVWCDGKRNDIDPGEWIESILKRFDIEPAQDITLSLTVWDPVWGEG